jgi:hypothetical protein
VSANHRAISTAAPDDLEFIPRAQLVLGMRVQRDEVCRRCGELGPHVFELLELQPVTWGYSCQSDVCRSRRQKREG